METYAPLPPGDPFAASEALFTTLAADLAGPGAAGLTACELEELLDARGREVLRQLLQDHYDLRAAREEQQARARRGNGRPATGADGIARTRLESGHCRLLATLFGTVRVTRCAWRRPGAYNRRSLRVRGTPQLPSVPSFIPSSLATLAIGREVSITIFTASSLNSDEKLLFIRGKIPYLPDGHPSGWTVREVRGTSLT